MIGFVRIKRKYTDKVINITEIAAIEMKVNVGTGDIDKTLLHQKGSTKHLVLHARIEDVVAVLRTAIESGGVHDIVETGGPE